jgi:tRNA (guanine-N7-)-methyltransferase
MNAQNENRPRILYGRRRGKALRKSQKETVDTLLPRLHVPMGTDMLEPATLFNDRIRQYWLEIGFGAGEHLAWQAANHPQTGIIGCEPFLNGVAMLLRKVEQMDIADNVRIHNEAAELLMERLPDSCLDRIFLLFADPWPKSSHHKRRFICPDNIEALAHLLKDGAQLRIATDHVDYGAWILWHMLRSGKFEWLADHPGDWRERPADWPPTRYEAKALKEGRKSVYYRFRRLTRNN